MARPIPEFPDNVTVPDRPSGIVQKSYAIKIVTPLFGGGFKAGENDPSMLVRPTSIRGHLRFWWRTLHGARYNSVAAMRTAENEIWGSTKMPSNVGVQVIQPRSTQKRDTQQDFGFQRFGPEAYALFAAKSNNNFLLKEGGTFSVQLSYPSEWEGEQFRQQVESAVWAWVNFGGIGARTRRGCGALRVEALPIQNIPEDMFYRVLFGPVCNDAMSAWAASVQIYRNFRQQRNPGERNRPGRSHWTEPDVLRSHANRRDIDPNHLTPINDVTTESFPRTLLGAPIIFHSYQESALNSNVDVIHRTLGNTGRMASPVITRPVFYAGNWRSGLLILTSPDRILESIDGVYVHSEQHRYPVSSIRNEALRNIRAFVNSNGQADNAIDALIDFAQTNNFLPFTGD